MPNPRPIVKLKIANDPKHIFGEAQKGNYPRHMWCQSSTKRKMRAKQMRWISKRMWDKTRTVFTPNKPILLLRPLKESAGMQTTSTTGHLRQWTYKKTHAGMLLVKKIPTYLVVFHPLHTLNTQCFFHCSIFSALFFSLLNFLRPVPLIKVPVARSRLQS